MRNATLTVLVALFLLAPLGAAQSRSRSGVLTLPAGGRKLHGVFLAAQDLLSRQCTIDKSVVDKHLEASVTYYDSASTASSATAKTSLTWTLEFRTEADGRITVSIAHAAVGSRPPESLVRFARDLATAAGAPSEGATLQLNGVTKPLGAWKRS